MIVEHPVDATIRLAGSPRWWTVTNHRGRVEVVRAVFDRETYFPDAEPDPRLGELPPAIIFYVVLQPDQYNWPPLCVAALRMGTEGLDHLKKSGAEIYSHDHPKAQKLEKLLVGVVN